MFTFSNFQQLKPAFTPPLSKDYKVFVNGEEIPVYTCRISAYPFNVWWQGHQRDLSQSEIVSFVNLISDEEIKIEVEPLTKTAFNRIMLKPYSKGVKVEKVGNRVAFTLTLNGGYALELDDYHALLYIFNNKPVPCENPENYTYYFGAGTHFAGKIILHSNESIFIDKDAFVYGNIFAENAENISILGNGIFDDSTEERVAPHCYEAYTNGNVKFYNCKNIKIQGVGWTNSAVWCVNIFHCENVEIDGINVFGQWRYNTDGIDVVNSKKVTIKNSFVHSFDDTIVVKGIDNFAQQNCEDILTENCTLWCDWGKTLEIGFETHALEYKNITFKNCDILRGGNTVCDIQNGDCAFVHDVVFEDIRVELENFYTQEELQESDDAVYTKQNTLAIPFIFFVRVARFRNAYTSLSSKEWSPYLRAENDPLFASVQNITVKNIQVYADEKLMQLPKKDLLLIGLFNEINAHYANFTVENVYLNGEPVISEDFTVISDVKEKVLKIL